MVKRAMGDVFCLMVGMLLLGWGQSAHAQEPDYSRCMSGETGTNAPNGSIDCKTLEDAFAGARNAAYALNTYWSEIGSPWTAPHSTDG